MKSFSQVLSEIGGFGKLSESSLITESFDSALEVYATEDTNPPNLYVSRFNIDGQTYVARVARSNNPKVFLTSLIRMGTGGKKLGAWSFRKSSHIRPALATYIKILDDIIEQSLKTKIDGLVLAFGKSNVDRDKIEFIIERAMRRTKSVRKFELSDVIEGESGKTIEKAIFINRRGKSPKQIFVNSIFSGYDFAAVEDIEQLKPVRREPVRLSDKPSVTFDFHGYKVEVSKEIFDTNHNTLKGFKGESDADEEKLESMAKEYEQTLEARDDIYLKLTHSKNNFDQHQGMPFPYDKEGRAEGNSKKFSGHAIIRALSQDFYIEPNIEEMDEQTFQNYKDSLNDIVISRMQAIAPETSSDLWNPVFQIVSGSLGPHNNIKNVSRIGMKNLLDSITESEEGAPVRYSKIIEELQRLNTLQNKFQKISEKSTELDHSIREERKKIKNRRLADVDFEVSPMGFDVQIDPNDRFPFKFAPSQGYISMTKREKEVLQLSNYGDYLNTLANDDGVDEEHYRAYRKFRDYTANYYEMTNRLLRLADSYDSNSMVTVFEDVVRMVNLMFDYLPRTEQGFWVFRNAKIEGFEEMEIGEDIIDYAFMSTSLNPSIEYGQFGNGRLSIYIPEGSVIFPALTRDHSKNADEYEIILPPASIIRPIDILEFDGKVHTKAVYVGTAARSYIANLAEKRGVSLDENNKEMIMENEKKNSKFDEPMMSREEMKEIQRRIERGELKVDENNYPNKK